MHIPSLLLLIACGKETEEPPACPVDERLPIRAPMQTVLSIAAGDLDGDGLTDLVIGDPEHGFDSRAAGDGQVHIAWGPASGAIDILDEEDVLLYPLRPYGLFGADLAIIEDATGDGIADLLTASQFHATAWLFAGGSTLETTTTGQALLEVQGAEGSFLGSWVSSAGDVDGDGLSEILIEASALRLSSGEYASALLLFPGGIEDVHPMESASATIRAEGTETLHGVAAGVDLSGDGVPDIATAMSGPACAGMAGPCSRSMGSPTYARWPARPSST